jgi:hypothetical protein
MPNLRPTPVRSETNAAALRRFYPDAWMFEAGPAMTIRPCYYVQCDTVDEQRLAHEIKPSFIDARIVLRSTKATYSDG